jgi:hypothetical protein
VLSRLAGLSILLFCDIKKNGCCPQAFGEATDLFFLLFVLRSWAQVIWIFKCHFWFRLKRWGVSSLFVIAFKGYFSVFGSKGVSRALSWEVMVVTGRLIDQSIIGCIELLPFGTSNYVVPGIIDKLDGLFLLISDKVV